MVDVEAAGITFTVVAVKHDGRFILRGIKKWSTPEAVQQTMLPYVAIIEQDELEWTFHQYRLPGYLAYGDGDIPRMLRPVDGLYLHRAVEQEYAPGEQTMYGDGVKLVGW